MAERQDSFEEYQNFLFTDIQDLLNLPASDLVAFTDNIEQSQSQDAIWTETDEPMLLPNNVYDMGIYVPVVTDTDCEIVEHHPTDHSHINIARDHSAQTSTRTYSVIVQHNQKECKNAEGKNSDKRADGLTPACKVCGDKAGKHAYYGGIVCGSCRAFFRRSVQSKYYSIFQCKISENCEIKSTTKKKCQFCRFQKCLAAGMKTSWVLSDEERDRRFNKHNKINSGVKQSKSVSELYMKFTMEEQNVLKEIHQQFQFSRQTWLANLFHLNREAGLNILEATFKVAPLKKQNHMVLEQAFQLYFVTNIVPKFLKNDNLPNKDIGQILNGQNSEIAHVFKISQFKTNELRDENIKHLDYKAKKQVSDLVNNCRVVENLNMGEILSKLPGQIGPTVLSYDELYPEDWANDKEIEDRHRDIVKKIQRWPTDERNKFDYSLVFLMTVILLFNPDFNPLVTRSVVEPIQLKYVMLLQRYLRYKLCPEMANKKFLEAMLLLSYTRELWELNNVHANLILQNVAAGN